MRRIWLEYTGEHDCGNENTSESEIVKLYQQTIRRNVFKNQALFEEY